MICRAVMPSDTLARKAQRMLTAKGYACELVRNNLQEGEGCGFGLKIAGDCDEIRMLLRREGIPVRGMRNERDGG